jgi:hypothetical protein
MVPHPDRSTAVEELRRAVELVQRYTPPALANDALEVRRRVGWIIQGFADTRTCERCGASFTFDAVRYARGRMPAPRKCRACKRQR